MDEEVGDQHHLSCTAQAANSQINHSSSSKPTPAALHIRVATWCCSNPGFASKWPQHKPHQAKVAAASSHINQQHITQEMPMMSTSGIPKPSCTRKTTCTREAKAQARDITPYPFGANAHLYNLYNLYIYKQLQWEITV